jgi:hypothetical protein
MGKRTPRIQKWQVDAVTHEINTTLANKKSELDAGWDWRPVKIADIIASGDPRIKLHKSPLTMARVKKHLTTTNAHSGISYHTFGAEACLLGMTNLKSIAEANRAHNEKQSLAVEAKMKPLYEAGKQLKLEVSLLGADRASEAIKDLKALAGRVK